MKAKKRLGNKRFSFSSSHPIPKPDEKNAATTD